MKNNYFSKDAKPGRQFFKKKIPEPILYNGNEPLPCKNLREEFDFIIKKYYKIDADDILRQLWQHAGKLLITNSRASITEIAHQVMADYLGIQTLGTA